MLEIKNTIYFHCMLNSISEIRS